ncbi:cystatin-A-like isoform 1-T4 [Anomaloglossus baeobatrachus]|uniref:cystatin-A-like n=1 Tax=Anomaloglossus baeobatrachus TaxID=238106 RepID=UPI003F503FC9
MAASGGFGEEQPADEGTQAACDKVKAEFIQRSGYNATKFKALLYIYQIVAATIYVVKVDIGGQCCHLKIFVPPSHTGEEPALLGWQCGKTETQAITYF